MVPHQTAPELSIPSHQSEEPSNWSQNWQPFADQARTIAKAPLRLHTANSKKQPKTTPIVALGVRITCFKAEAVNWKAIASDVLVPLTSADAAERLKSFL